MRLPTSNPCANKACYVEKATFFSEVKCTHPFCELSSLSHSLFKTVWCFLSCFLLFSRCEIVHLYLTAKTNSLYKEIVENTRKQRWWLHFNKHRNSHENREQCVRKTMSMDLKQVVAAILTMSMFLMLGNMIKKEHIDPLLASILKYVIIFPLFITCFNRWYDSYHWTGS